MVVARNSYTKSLFISGNLSTLTRFIKVRDAELLQQWQAYVAETLLVLCWIAAPVMLAAIVLSAVVLIEGVLLPSVAFTALAIFQRLENTLSLVPTLVTDFVNARVSLNRIDEFLTSPERSDATVDADTVILENASIAWPSNTESNERFTLRNLDLHFPKHELSIISGPTGAGKSLLLAMAVGEADIVDGTVRRPTNAPDDNELGFENHGSGWIVPKATAFVAQIPWIENATLRDNVLFGLPFSESRYMSVLGACALDQDVATFEHGDLTEIGSHGLNLSGGQRSRLSLARALYSRAEMLVLDDIFSAVDTNVGRHILNHALTGRLVQGRTRVLSTHHIQLCLPKAKYTVVLSNGTVGYAGPPEEVSLDLPPIERSVNLDESNVRDALQNPITKAHHTLETKLVNSGEAHHNLAMDRIPSSYQIDSEENIEDGIIDTSSSEDHEMNMREERYSKGLIELDVYKQYLCAASTWPWMYWSIAVGLLSW